jgi:hypothetical protein
LRIACIGQLHVKYKYKQGIHYVMSSEIETLSNRIDQLEEKVTELKENMIDMDLVLTEDDLDAIKEGDKDLASGDVEWL